MSTCAVAAASFAPRTASPGRSDVLDGMHPLGALATDQLVLDELQTTLCERAGAVALTVYTRETFPAQWAANQHNLAYAYQNRTVSLLAVSIDERFIERLSEL